MKMLRIWMLSLMGLRLLSGLLCAESQQEYFDNSVAPLGDYENIRSNMFEVGGVITSLNADAVPDDLGDMNPLYVHKGIRVLGQLTEPYASSALSAVSIYVDLDPQKILFNTDKAGIFGSNSLTGFVFDDSVGISVRSRGSIYLQGRYVSSSGLMYATPIYLHQNTNKDYWKISGTSNALVFTIPKSTRDSATGNIVAAHTNHGIIVEGSTGSQAPALLMSVRNDGDTYIKGNLNIEEGSVLKQDGIYEGQETTLVPRGTIVAFAGTTLPSLGTEWVVCNGTVYNTPRGPLATPDLKNKFLVGSPWGNVTVAGNINPGSWQSCGTSAHTHNLVSAAQIVTMEHDHPSTYWGNYVNYAARTENYPTNVPAYVAASEGHSPSSCFVSSPTGNVSGSGHWHLFGNCDDRITVDLPPMDVTYYVPAASGETTSMAGDFTPPYVSVVFLMKT